MQMKKEIRILIVLVFSMLFLCSCTSQNPNEVPEYIDITEEPTTAVVTDELTTEETTTEEPTTEYVELSEKCDYILCEGYDGEDFYQLVANEKEDYNGVKIKVGVIKNNEWVLKPTSKMPLVDKDKTLYGSDVAGLDDAPKSIYYIGFGCYLYRARTKEYHSTYEEIIYNAKNQKYYEQKNMEENEIVVFSPRPLDHTTSEDFEEDWEIKSKNVIITTTEYESETVLKILNLATMKIKEIKVQTPSESTGIHIVHPVSEGIFAIAGKYYGCNFYNTTGKLLFTIKYEEIPREYLYAPIIFEYNKCIFTVENNKGSIYDITVNEKGKVIDSKEFNE